MKTFLKWLVLAPLVIVALVFAVANRQIVTVVFDPFGNDIPGLSVTMPLFLALVCAVGFGVLLGGVAVWLSQGRYRRAARDARVRAAEAEEEARRLRMGPPASTSPAGLPAPIDSRRIA